MVGSPAKSFPRGVRRRAPPEWERPNSSLITSEEGVRDYLKATQVKRDRVRGAAPSTSPRPPVSCRQSADSRRRRPLDGRCVSSAAPADAAVQVQQETDELSAALPRGGRVLETAPPPARDQVPAARRAAPPSLASLWSSPRVGPTNRGTHRALATRWDAGRRPRLACPESTPRASSNGWRQLTFHFGAVPPCSLRRRPSSNRRSDRQRLPLGRRRRQARRLRCRAAPSARTALCEHDDRGVTPYRSAPEVLTRRHCEETRPTCGSAHILFGDIDAPPPVRRPAEAPSSMNGARRVRRRRPPHLPPFFIGASPPASACSTAARPPHEPRRARGFARR